MTRPQRAVLDSYRRPLLKALGAGAVLTTMGGTAAAQQDDGEDQDDGMDDDGEATVHRVETRITGPPTNPERPADFFYQPTGLHVQPGDVVKFVFVTPDHNVVSMHPAFGMRRRVPTGVDAYSSPLLGWKPSSIPGDQIDPPAEMGDGGGTDGDGTTDGESGPEPDTWLHAFETPGVYDMVCSPHEEFGMALRVVVGDETATEFETSNPDDLPEPRAGPVELARLTLTDAALQPAAIVRQGRVEWESLEANQGGESST